MSMQAIMIKVFFQQEGQLRFNYFFSQSRNTGVHLGAYYSRHFNVTELVKGGKSASYWKLDDTTLPGSCITKTNGNTQRLEPCIHDLSSVGVIAGLTFRFPKKSNCNVCGLDHTPHCCATCGCGVTVTAKDKFTGELLPDTDIVLTDLNGNVVKSTTTNSYGVAVFEDLSEDDYLIKGKLYNIDLEENTISKDEFKNCKKNSAWYSKRTCIWRQKLLF